MPVDAADGLSSTRRPNGVAVLVEQRSLAGVRAISAIGGPVNANKQFLDQQPIVGESRRKARHTLLLVCEVRIVDDRQTGEIPLREHPSELPSGSTDATRHDERRTSKIG